MTIIWNDELKTNIRIIDQQHQTIIKLLSGVKTSKLTKADIYKLLSELQEILFLHFDTEEKCMIEAEYPDYKKHKSNHDKAKNDCQYILTRNDADYSPSEIALELIDYIRKWFLIHYKNEDVKMAKYLKQKF